ncbi:MAG: shikimate dehydrogenase [Cryomorphaceae bacterium]|nr:MAG: shikimate dehydrogenase [Cryomorphaceae bacterium]
MRVYGLIGYPLHHSFSKTYFAAKFEREGIKDAVYRNFEIEDIRDFTSLLESNRALCGLNVTIPYKRAVIPFLDGLDPHAETIGAVNTIHFSDGRKTGYNTDWIGFRQSLEPYLKPYHDKALILGSGGASLAVQYALKQMRIDFLVVSRSLGTHHLSYSDLSKDLLKDHRLILNTTPLGTTPNVESMPPITLEGIGSKHLVFDLIYNPPQTRFMIESEKLGAQTLNGYQMLVAQAEAAWDIWLHGYQP